MNWKKLILAGGVAFTTSIVPFATSQAAPHGNGGSRGQASVSARGSSGIHSGRSFNRGGGRFNNGRWSNGRWNGRGNHRHFYPRYYYSGYYPFGFGYPFGYGYGYGSGYGYGYGPYYGSTVYNGRDASNYRNGGGSLAVEIQQELSRAGYYRGSIDGVIGDGTRRAIRAYERANGLPVDGRVDQQLLETMGVS